MMLTKRAMTAEEFEFVSANRGPCELVAGEIVEMSPAGDRHSYVVMNIGALLWNWAQKYDSGRVHGGEAGLRTRRNPDTVRGADLAYVSYARKPKGPASVGFLSVPPDLIIEVVGKGRGWSDLLTKATEYLDFGVDVVWIADPEDEAVTVIRRDRAPQRFESADPISDPIVLPGFECTVSQFF